MDKQFLLLLFAICVGLSILGGAIGSLLYLDNAADGGFMPFAVGLLPSLKLDGRFDQVTLEVEGHQTQTNNLIEAQQYTQTVVFYISNDGNVLISGTLTISDTLTLLGDLTATNLDLSGNVDADGYISATSNITSSAKIYGMGIDGSDADIDNVGDIKLDDISDDGANGIDVNLTDDLAGALQVLQGASLYMQFDTLNGSEKATIYKWLDMNEQNIIDVGDVALDTISADDGSNFSMSNDWTNAGNTVADLGTVTTADIDGGTLDGVAIGGSSASTGRFTTVDATTSVSCTGNITGLNVTTSGLVDIGTFLNLSPQTAQSIANTDIITPTGSYHRLSVANSVSEITVTIETDGFLGGDIVLLTNTTTPTIHIEDTGTAKLSGDWAGGLYDTLLIVFDGTNWLQFPADN